VIFKNFIWVGVERRGEYNGGCGKEVGGAAGQEDCSAEDESQETAVTLAAVEAEGSALDEAHCQDGHRIGVPDGGHRHRVDALCSGRARGVAPDVEEPGG